MGFLPFQRSGLGPTYPATLVFPFSDIPLLTLCCSFSKSIMCYFTFLFGCFCGVCPFPADTKLFRRTGNTSHSGGHVTQWFRAGLCLGSHAGVVTLQPGQAGVCSWTDSSQGCRGFTPCFLLILNVPLRLAGGLWSSRSLRNLGFVPVPTSMITTPEQREHGGSNSGC